MDFTGGLAAEVAKLPAEMQPILTALLDRIDALEAQSAKDANLIADKLISAITPMVAQAVESINTLTLTVGASVQLLTATAQRIDGATVTVKLGPEPGA